MYSGDCRPPLLPVSLRLKDIGPLPLRRTVVSASLAAPPQEDFMAIGGVSPEKVAIPELCVAPLVDPDTDLKDELGTLCCLVIREFVPRLRISQIWNWKGTAQRVCPACHSDTSRGACRGFSGGSIYVSGASCSCSARRRSRCDVAVLSTPVAAKGPILDVFPSYLISLACSAY